MAGVVNRTARSRGGRLRQFLDVAIVFCGTAVIAFWGLIVEDLFPVDRQVEFSAVRITVGLVLLLLLLLLVYFRQRRNRARGTLYYLRYLFEWMTDWRLENLNAVKAGHPDLRVITRWASTPIVDDVWDVSADVDELSQELRRTMNDDRVDTGYNLAPNLLFPAGVGLGYELFRWDGLTLEELFDGPDPVALSWVLRSPGRDGEGFDHPQIVPPEPFGEPNADRSPVLVTVELTGSPIPSIPAWTFSRRYRVGFFPQSGDDPAAPVRVLARHPADRERGGSHLVHPWQATVAAVTALRRALHENPDNMVVVAARVPKTVAVAIGWLLSDVAAHDDPGCGHLHCVQESCRHPWRRLVPAHFDQEQNRWVLTRVHRGQPSAAEIRAGTIGGQGS